MRRKGNEVCPSFLSQLSHLLSLTHGLSYIVSGLVRTWVSWKCLDFDSIRSSDATCYASMAMAVNTCFFSSGATTSKIWPPGAPKLGAELIFMSSLGRPPHWDSIVIRTPPISPSKMTKTGKINKNPLFIRYN